MDQDWFEQWACNELEIKKLLHCYNVKYKNKISMTASDFHFMNQSFKRRPNNRKRRWGCVGWGYVRRVLQSKYGIKCESNFFSIIDACINHSHSPSTFGQKANINFFSPLFSLVLKRFYEGFEDFQKIFWSILRSRKKNIFVAYLAFCQPLSTKYVLKSFAGFSGTVCDNTPSYWEKKNAREKLFSESCKISELLSRKVANSCFWILLWHYEYKTYMMHLQSLQQFFILIFPEFLLLSSTFSLSSNGKSIFSLIIWKNFWLKNVIS